MRSSSDATCRSSCCPERREQRRPVLHPPGDDPGDADRRDGDCSRPPTSSSAAGGTMTRESALLGTPTYTVFMPRARCSRCRADPAGAHRRPAIAGRPADDREEAALTASSCSGTWLGDLQARRCDGRRRGQRRALRARAGTPATTSPAATSFVTTAPAPTRAPCADPHPAEDDRPGADRGAALDDRPSSSQSSSPAARRPSVVARGRLSFTNITPWPTKTSSSIVTPSQMNVWLWILQRAPTTAPLWISTKVPIRVSSPMRHPYRFANAWIDDAFAELDVVGDQAVRGVVRRAVSDASK